MDSEKLLEWLKRVYGVKERVVFGIAVLVLAFVVYLIFTEPEINPESPQGDQPKARIEIPNIALPPPGPRVQLSPLANYTMLYTPPDMFTEQQPTAGSGVGGDEDEGRHDFILDSIQKTPRGLVAIIYRPGGRKEFVRKNDIFESDFKLTDIDIDNKTVKIFDSETGKTFTVSVQE